LWAGLERLATGASGSMGDDAVPAAQYGWEIRQFDIAKAYMLAAPQRAYYLYFPPGFRDYLLARHSGNLPFEPSQYLLRVQKNI